STFLYPYRRHRLLHSFPTRRSSDLKLAAFAEIAACSQYLKKFVDLVDNFRGQANAIGVARHCKQSFFRACVIETLHRCTQKVLRDRKSTRLNSSHVSISYAVFCLKK